MTETENIVIWTVETQKDFMLGSPDPAKNPQKHFGTLYAPDAEDIIPNLELLFKEALNSNFRIWGSADDHTANSPELKSNGGDWPDHCMRGTEGQKHLLESVVPLDKVGIVRYDKKYKPGTLDKLLSMQRVILNKDDLDVFNPAHGNPHVQELLARAGPDTTIYVTGVATEFCVALAIRGLVAWAKENGGKVVLVEDAVKGITKDGVQKALKEFNALGVSSTTTVALLEQMKLVNERRSKVVEVTMDGPKALKQATKLANLR